MGGSKNSIKISIPSVVEKGKRNREPEEDSLTGRFYNDNKNYQNIISDLKTKIRTGWYYQKLKNEIST